MPLINGIFELVGTAIGMIWELIVWLFPGGRVDRIQENVNNNEVFNRRREILEEAINPRPFPEFSKIIGPGIFNWVSSVYAQPLPTRTGGDPLVLDLNRDGKIDLSNATFFDLNASGFHEYTRWINETDAFLVLDVNGNGIIDNGSEMFGDSMRLPDGSVALSGFEALRSYDSNGDGKIDKNDEIFSSLKLLTGAGQLVSLADAGVKSITLPPFSPQ